MSGGHAAVDHFADGGLVLVGDDHEHATFIATAADTIASDRLGRLHELGRGMVVLGLSDGSTRRLGLTEPRLGEARHKLGLALTTPIDAATGIGSGWSLRDRAITMRVAADPNAGPGDLEVPGHVYPAVIGEQARGAATATMELARLCDRPEAVALAAVVDRHGNQSSLREAREHQELARLPVAAPAELMSLAVARGAGRLAVACELPTREGAFRALGYGPAAHEPATVALIHGAPESVAAPLAHIHVACLLGDAFGSRLCNCRRELDAAIDAIVATGAGVVVYAQPQRSTGAACARDECIDMALVAGLLRAAGVERPRLSAPATRLRDDLRACGLAPEPVSPHGPDTPCLTP